MKWLKITLLIIQKIKPRQERQRRTPRHLRTSNNQRRRRNEVKSPMPLFAAVASPELKR